MYSIHDILQGSSATNPGTPSPRLVHASHEFEAQMMKELLKPMTQSEMLSSDNDQSSSGSFGALKEFASQALGQAISEHGGFGVAQDILARLSHLDKHSASKK